MLPVTSIFIATVVALVAVIVVFENVFGTMNPREVVHAWRLSRIIKAREGLTEGPERFTGNLGRYGYYMRHRDSFGTIWQINDWIPDMLRRCPVYGVEAFALRGRRASFERILEVVCPSTGQHHYLRVPNDLRARTGRAAVAWTFGMQPDAYQPVKEA